MHPRPARSGPMGVLKGARRRTIGLHFQVSLTGLAVRQRSDNHYWYATHSVHQVCPSASVCIDCESLAVGRKAECSALV